MFSDLSENEIMQLIMGMTYSLKNMVQKLSPEPDVRESTSSSRKSSAVNSPTEDGSASTPSIEIPKDICFSYMTSKYRLAYYESVTGWKLVLLLDPSNLNNSIIEKIMKGIYQEILVKNIIQSPMFRMNEESYIRPSVLIRLDEFLATISIK